MHPRTYDLFISYRSSDLHLAEMLHDSLLDGGFRIWFDRERLDPGCDWHREIETASENSRIILPILTPEWQESEWCRFETFGGEHIIPILFRGSWPDVAPLPLRTYQFVDFRQRRERAWSKLTTAIREYLQEPPPDKSSRLSSLAYSHNPYFVGREHQLLEIHERFFRNSPTALTQGSALALIGLGGIGKTTLAREYAEKFWRLYQDILWVRAEPELLPMEFARIAVELRLTSQPSRNVNQDARRAMLELTSRTPRLLILDNATDEKSAQRWIPAAGGCRTIVTSRFAGWSAGVQSIPVDVLPASSARELLLRRGGLEKSRGNPGEADLVAKELGYLPLALEQAAAFVQKAALSFHQYLDLYARSRRALLDQGALGGTQYPDSLVTTWQTTIGRLGPSAIAILRLCAFFAPGDIPIQMLEKAGTFLGNGGIGKIGASIYHFFQYLIRTQKNTRFRDSTTHVNLSTRLALAELAEYSMVSLLHDGIAVHPLVQAVQIDGLKKRKRKLWARRAVMVVDRSLPYIEHSNFASYWPLYARILPHATAAARLIAEWKFAFPQAWRLLNQCACYLMDHGEYAQAERLFLQALAIRHELGERHQDFATTVNSLSVLYTRMGKYAEAEDFQRRSLELLRDIFGEHHPQYAESLNNLAVLHDTKGNYSLAEPLYRQALAIYRESSGQNHPRYAQLVNNLAVLLYRSGNYAAAESLYYEALQIRRAVLGDADPELAYILANMATLYRAQGRYAEAEPLYQRALDIRRESLGDAHPEFGRNMSDLAILYDLEGDHTKAEALHRRALEIIRAALGPEHALVAKVLDNYASSLRRARRLSEAQEIELQAEAIRHKHALDDGSTSANAGLGHS